MSREPVPSRAEQRETLGLRLDLALQSFAAGIGGQHPDYRVTGVSTLGGLVSADFRDRVGVAAEVQLPIIQADEQEPVHIGYVFKNVGDGWKVYEMHQTELHEPRELQVLLAESHVEVFEASCVNAHMVAFEKLAPTASQRAARIRRMCGYAIGKRMVIAAHWGAARLGYPNETIR